MVRSHCARLPHLTSIQGPRARLAFACGHRGSVVMHETMNVEWDKLAKYKSNMDTTAESRYKYAIDICKGLCRPQRQDFTVQVTFGIWSVCAYEYTMWRTVVMGYSASTLPSRSSCVQRRVLQRFVTLGLFHTGGVTRCWALRRKQRRSQSGFSHR